jgi:hypothetical protein
MTTEAEKIRSVLVVDEEKMLEGLLNRVAEHIAIDKQGGVHLKGTKYRDVDRVALYLLGKHLAFRAKLIDHDIAGYKEVARETGLSAASASARLLDLRRRNRIESPRKGMNRIIFARASDILDEIDSAMRRRGGVAIVGETA